MVKKVSVIVPNFNHERFLKKRLTSILNQTYPIYELLFLDDASSDKSVQLAKRILKDVPFPVKFCVNKINSGSTFKQWYKGLCLSKGDYIWIAESDDYCESTFLENVIKPFDDEEVVLSYSQSAVVDENDNIIHENYLHYTNDISNDWTNDFKIDGKLELWRSFVFKNVIPNASAVIFRKKSLEKIFEKHKSKIFDFKVAGDYYIYVLLSFEGKLAFISKTLNYHRTHLNTRRNVCEHSNETEFIKDFVSGKLIEIIDATLLNGKNDIFITLNNVKFFLNNYKKNISMLKKEIDNYKGMIQSIELLAKLNSSAIFGLGKSGKMTYEFIKKYYPEKIKYFIDDNVKGEYEGIPIVTTDEFLAKHQTEVDIVVFGKYQHLNPKLLPNLKIKYLRLENIV